MDKILRKIGYIVLILAIIIALIGTYQHNTHVMSRAYWITIIGYIIFIASYWIAEDKMEKDNVLYMLEISELIYSYRQMGEYIKDKDIPELEDIQVRIENELSDIAIRVKHRADWINKKGI